SVTFGSGVGLPLWPMAGMLAARRTKTSAMILSVVIEFLKSIIASTGRKDQVSKVQRSNKNQNLGCRYQRAKLNSESDERFAITRSLYRSVEFQRSRISVEYTPAPQLGPSGRGQRR